MIRSNISSRMTRGREAKNKKTKIREQGGGERMNSEHERV